MVISSAFAGVALSDDSCAVMERPKDFARKFVSIRATVTPTMHGTYLVAAGCAVSLIVVLPEEIPKYRGTVKTIKDGAFDQFMRARYDFRPEREVLEATLKGQVETASPSRGFGYYHKNPARLVLGSVESATAGKRIGTH